MGGPILLTLLQLGGSAVGDAPAAFDPCAVHYRSRPEETLTPRSFPEESGQPRTRPEEC